ERALMIVAHNRQL
ncbi:hypothetical protein vseg_014627, partial [Gypsophila vaccaria]